MLRSLTVILLFLVVLLGLLYVASFSWIFEPTDALPASEVAILQVKAEIYEKFFQIFITVTAIISGFAATLAVAVFNLLKTEVITTVEKRVTERLTVSQTYSVLTTYVQLSMDEFWEFEPAFNSVLMHESIAEETRLKAALHAKRAHTKTSIGMDRFERLDEQSKRKFLEDAENATIFIELLNHRFYARSARFMLSEDRRTIGESELLEMDGWEIISVCDDLVRVASKEAISGCYDSVITCLYAASKLTGNRNLKLKSIKLAHKFLNSKGQSYTTSFAQQTDLENVRRILAEEVL